MKARPYPRWISRLFILLAGVLAVTGFMQMPITKRYYLSDLPGMAWSANFYTVHRVHYVLAALFLLLLGIVAANWFRAWRGKLALTGFGWARIAVVAALVVSGGFRVYRNLPGVTLDPSLVLAIDWVHLIAAVLLGVLALAALIARRSAYAVRR
ncbi:MAG: 4Fe-4S ferredoxin [Desulfovibrionaceae bacterium]|nr:4Fe-4S ferredoxin [Desulfovibrionaceae bacterium]